MLSGVGQPVLGQTPKDTVWSSGKVQLWRYRSEQRSLHPPLLFVHSLVSRSYVFDLAPGNSFVEFMLDWGFDVFLVDWGEPDEMEAANTLETYCDDLMPELVDVVADAGGTDHVTMFGYCIGGVLALLYLAGHRDSPVSALATLATPIDFRHMGTMSTMLQRVDPEALIDQTGNVSAEVIRNSFTLLQPTADVASYVNLWQNLWDDQFVTAHQTVTRWAKDHVPFPGACMIQLARLLVRDNLLASGRVPMGDRIVDLADITAPFLSIRGQKDHIVPMAATGNLPELVGSADIKELSLPAGHVGLIVGRTARQRYLPAMAEWLSAHSQTTDRSGGTA